MKKYGVITLELNKMDAVKKQEGVPHILGVPCIWDRYYKFSSAEFLGLSEWLCPHCFTNLCNTSQGQICLNDCHLGKKPPEQED